MENGKNSQEEENKVHTSSLVVRSQKKKNIPKKLRFIDNEVIKKAALIFPDKIISSPSHFTQPTNQA